MRKKLTVSIDPNFYFFTVYYEGSWAAMPLFFVPENAVDEETGVLHRIKLLSPDGTPFNAMQPEAPSSNGVSAITSCIVPWLMPKEKLQELCQRFDIPIGWVTGILPKSRAKKAGLRRGSRKIVPLTDTEWQIFIKQLRKQDKHIGLLAEIVWFINNQLAAGGGFVTLEEILRLKMEDVSPETDGSPCLIRCQRKGFSGFSMISHYLPSPLWVKLKAVAKPDSSFIFSDKNGVPLFLNYIERSFKKAGKLAGIDQEVVPLCLRPHFDDKMVELSKKHARDRALMNPVSQEEWRIIYRQLPAVVQRRGCKSTHEPLLLLNAIFYHLLEDCPFRELLSGFPHWCAVAAQYRRWKKSGILEEVLDVREAINKEFGDNAKVFTGRNA